MADPLDVRGAALSAAKELLVLGGRPEWAELLAGAELETAGPPERWEVGSRNVEAMAFALVVDPAAFVRLRDTASWDAVKDAIASVVRSPSTELARLQLVVRLPAIGRAWEHVYRSVSTASPPDRASDDAVLAGARELALALDEQVAADALGGATLESATVMSGPDRALRRLVLRLPALWLARAEKSRDLADRLRWLVEQAATRAVEGVADVELRLRLSG